MGPWSGTAKSISKFFLIPNVVCAQIKIPMRFSFCCLVHASGVGLVVLGFKNYFFFEHDHVAYPIKGNDESNKIQVKNLS